MKCVGQEEDDGPLLGSSPFLSPILANIFAISCTAVKDVAMTEGSIDWNYLIIMCTISRNSKEISTHTLIDCVATGCASIDQDIINHDELPLCQLKTPYTLEVIHR
jgi:hypothetical protein